MYSILNLGYQFTTLSPLDLVTSQLTLAFLFRCNCCCLTRNISPLSFFNCLFRLMFFEISYPRFPDLFSFTSDLKQIKFLNWPTHANWFAFCYHPNFCAPNNLALTNYKVFYNCCFPTNLS